MNGKLLCASCLTALFAMLPELALAQAQGEGLLGWYGQTAHGRYTIVTDADGNVTVQRDQTPIAGERLERDARALRVLDEEGRVLFEIELTEDGRVVMPKGATLTLPPVQRKRATIGVNMAPVSEALAAQLDVAADETVLISEVVEDQPAARAGLRRFDVVTAIDGAGPAGSEDLKKQLARKKAGDTITLTVRRGGTTRDVPIEVEEVAVAEDNRFAVYTLGDQFWPLMYPGGALQGDVRHRWLEAATKEYLLGPYSVQTDTDGTFRISAVDALKQKKEEQNGAAQAADKDEQADLADLNERLRRVEELLEKLVADKE